MEKNHASYTELWVGYYKLSAKKKSITWVESVEVALCFGWIDGIRKSVDEISYTNRFTPRKKESNWSAVNLKKMEELLQNNLVHPAGMKIYEQRLLHKCEVYSYEQKPKILPPTMLKKFKAYKKAWTFFQSLAPSYQKNYIQFILSAKQETTQWNRLEKCIQQCQDGINPWKLTPKK